MENNKKLLIFEQFFHLQRLTLCSTFMAVSFPTSVNVSFET